ncbi:MAG TPA: hypothetical protein VE890_09380, partial [Thermoguttaceae bacterium]|nr:hypothetical protein [Thermoguttaceae bacterium]
MEEATTPSNLRRSDLGRRDLRRHIDSPWGYAAIALLLLIVGGTVTGYLIATRPKPSGTPTKDPGRLVQVFKADKSSHRLAVTAYGTTRASQQWKAIAEVSGRAIEISPRFEPGEILPAGELLVRIDPTDYQLAATRLEAEARAKAVQLHEIDQNETNLDEILNLLQQQASLASKEYERQRELFDRNATSRAGLEAAERAYITSRTTLQQTRNELALLPARRDLLQASLDAANAQLAQAQRDLAECEIRLPSAARCAEKSVEENQYVTMGERLGTFLALDTTEVVAMVEARQMSALFPGGAQAMGPLDFTQFDRIESFWKQLKIPVEVSWGTEDRRWTWPGRVARIASSLDPGTRTIPVIVEVPDPYKGVQPGIRPPLIPDVFCKVTAYGATVDDVVVIPREALHNDRVYLLRDNQLDIARVKVLALEEDLAVIQEGIEASDMVVLTDLAPASQGMPLR